MFKKLFGFIFSRRNDTVPVVMPDQSSFSRWRLDFNQVSNQFDVARDERFQLSRCFTWSRALLCATEGSWHILFVPYKLRTNAR